MKKLLIRHKPLRNLSLAGFLLGFALVPFRAAALEPNQAIFQYHCQSWSRHSGLPVNNVYAIAQTKDGYLWLGTSAGLFRFDGVEFTLVGAPLVSELRNTRITCLAPSRNGGIWFGLDHSAYGFYDTNNQWFVGKNPQGNVDWDVPSLQETADGTLCVGGEYGSLIKPGTTNMQLLFAGQPAAPFVTAVLQDSQGRTWLGTASQGLFCWQDGKLSKFPDPTLDNRLIHALAEDRQGRLWVGTHVGLLCYDANSKSLPVQYPGVEITCLLVDRQGLLWGGTTGNGIFRSRNNFFASLRKADGLASDDVLAMARRS